MLCLTKCFTSIKYWSRYSFKNTSLFSQDATHTKWKGLSLCTINRTVKMFHTNCSVKNRKQPAVKDYKSMSARRVMASFSGLPLLHLSFLLQNFPCAGQDLSKTTNDTMFLYGVQKSSFTFMQLSSCLILFYQICDTRILKAGLFCSHMLYFFSSNDYSLEYINALVSDSHNQESSCQQCSTG